jgi:hypothetical protein
MAAMLARAGGLPAGLSVQVCRSKYYGPGGLSAEELLSAVRSSRAKDEQQQQQKRSPHPPRSTGQQQPPQQPTQAAGGAASASTPNDAPFSAEGISGMSSKVLRQALVQRGVDCSGCFEREDLLRLARQIL